MRDEIGNSSGRIKKEKGGESIYFILSEIQNLWYFSWILCPIVAKVMLISSKVIASVNSRLRDFSQTKLSNKGYSSLIRKLFTPSTPLIYYHPVSLETAK